MSDALLHEGQRARIEALKRVGLPGEFAYRLVTIGDLYKELEESALALGNPIGTPPEQPNPTSTTPESPIDKK